MPDTRPPISIAAARGRVRASFEGHEVADSAGVPADADVEADKTPEPGRPVPPMDPPYLE